MDYIKFLCKCDLFSGISDEEKENLLDDNRTSFCIIEENKFLFSENMNTEPKLCILCEGILEVLRVHNGSRVLLNEIKAPGIIGASVLFGHDEKFHTTVKAKKRCQVILFSQSQLVELIKENGDFAVKYITFLSDKIRFLNKKISSFTSGSSTAKLSYYLLKNSYNGQCLISRTRLASELDMGRASLYRALDMLTEQNLVQTNGKTIIIPDEKKLFAFAQEQNKGG